jgi:glycosyltransferase involved in cell wall biosynthesis
MRVLVLCKRQYTGKDLLDDLYGRLYELPLTLAQLGHEVHGVCASYRPRAEGTFVARREAAQVAWQSLNVQPYAPWSVYRWWRVVRERVAAFKPDVLWACSDAFHAILGVRCQRRSGTPCVVDLYDNFESFLGTAIPGIRRWFRSSVRQAAAVTCVSRALERYVRQEYGFAAQSLVLENGISGDFRPMDRRACRDRLGLPASARIIGTAGALDAERGIETLFRAFLQLAEKETDLYLLLAGRLGRTTRVPSHPRVVYLGELALSEVPCVIGAMDLSVVCNKRSAFGEYCFPQKLYEILACGVPPLVAGTAGVAALLEAAPQNRYEPESVPSLVQGIERLLARPVLPPICPVGWKEHGVALADLLAHAVDTPRMFSPREA